MTPKEEAKELFDEYYETTSTWRYFAGDNKKVAKQCALICVNKQIEFINNWTSINWDIRKIIIGELEETKNEIEKL